VRSKSTTSPAVLHEGDALMYDERLAIGFTRNLYIAFDIELGNYASPAESNTGPDLVIAGLATAGVRGRLGLLSVGAEIAGGALVTTYPLETDPQTEGAVELRGRANVWLTPWFTFGAVVGTSLLRSGEWMAGLNFGYHALEFGGG